jgi:hypothetical protein
MGESGSMDTSFPWIENEMLSVAINKTYVQMKADGIPNIVKVGEQITGKRAGTCSEPRQ